VNYGHKAAEALRPIRHSTQKIAVRRRLQRHNHRLQIVRFLLLTATKLQTILTATSLLPSLTMALMVLGMATKGTFADIHVFGRH